MQSIRPSRKRAGTSTNATPSDPARRIRLGPSPESDQDDKDSKITTWLCNHDPSQNVARTSPISIPIYNDHPTKHIPPPTPCSSPELQGQSNYQAGLDRSGYSINVQHDKPGYGTTYQHQRNEFSFPIQPLPGQLRYVRRLELTIPEEPEPGEFDINLDVAISASTGKRTGRPERPYVHSLPTPPRSHPSVPTCFSYSPPSTSYSQPPPTPSSTAPSSGLSSLSHLSSNPYSPTSPNTPSSPGNPLTRFNSAAAALKLVLMANDIGMTLQELEELNEFAAASMSGGSDSKRAGRVLVRRDIQQQREKGTGKGDGDFVWSGGQDIFHKREDCRFADCGRHVTAPGPGGMWRDVEWSRNRDGNGNRSRFSDSTCTTNGDVDMEMDGDTGGDQELTALEGYIKMAVDADTDADSEAGRSSNIVNVDMNVNQAVLGIAEVGRRVRPAELCMESFIEAVETAVGPLGERV